MKTAIILGATGLVGSQLLKLLLEHADFNKVLIFVRRSVNISHPKLVEHIINFDDPSSWKHLVKGDVLYSAFGTTIKKAGSKEAQYRIDYTYQYQMAEIASANGVSVYVLVSAAYSSPDSRVFYTRIKGELDRDVSKLPFRAIHILRPGMLAGDRKEIRLAERFGIIVLSALSALPGLGSLKPIKDIEVAKAMLRASSKETSGVIIYPNKLLFALAGAS